MNNSFASILEKNTRNILALQVDLKKLDRRVTSPAQRVAVVSVVGEFADAAEVDAAFSAVMGLTARNGDGVLVYVGTGDYLIILERVSGAWVGGKVAGAGVSYGV